MTGRWNWLGVGDGVDWVAEVRWAWEGLGGLGGAAGSEVARSAWVGG